MALVRVDNVGEIGIIRDLSPYEIPPEAWTDGNNVRFFNNKVFKILGHSSAFVPSIPPYHLLSVRAATENFWAYAGLAKVFATDQTVHNNITRQTASVDVDYAATEDTKWNGGVLNGIPILNNGFDEPQMWNPPALATRLQLLSGWSTWPGGVSTRAKVIRPAFRFFLVALNITESGTNFPQVLAWSNPADPGAVPTSWNYSDPAQDTGRTPIADTNGTLLDLVMMGGRAGIVYKSDSAYLMQLVGGQSVFSIDVLQGLERIGLLGTDCVKSFPGWHFMVTQDDVIIHNTREIKSVINSRVRNSLFDALDPTNRGRSFVVPNYKMREMWFFYVPTGQTQPTKVLIYNWDTGAIAFRDADSGAFGGIAHAAIGVNRGVSSSTWDSDSGTWDSDASIWDVGSSALANTTLLMARHHATSPAAFLVDNTNQFAGTGFTSFVERTGLTIVGRDRQGNPKTDNDSVKLVKRIIPRIKGGPVTVYVGRQDRRDGPITWDNIQAFNPATQAELTPYSVGRYPAVRFESVGNVAWELEGYDLDISIVGRY